MQVNECVIYVNLNRIVMITVKFLYVLSLFSGNLNHTHQVELLQSVETAPGENMQ